LGNTNDPLSLHKYFYAHGDPIDGIDPTGMFAAMAGASIASSIATVKMSVDFSVLHAVQTTVDKIRAGLTPAQIYERFMQDQVIAAVFTYGVMFAPGILAGMISVTPKALKTFIDAGCKGLWELLPKFRGTVGRCINDGGRKTIHAYGGTNTFVVAVAKEYRFAEDLLKELDLLGKLESMRFPVPTIKGTLEFQGKPAYIMQKYAQGSKDVVRTVNGNPKIIGSSAYLNQTSIQDLKAIKQMMMDKKVKIDDLQFLINYDGHIVIADPIDVIIGHEPSTINIRTINKLIVAAGGTP
jgi:hypothetical protein